MDRAAQQSSCVGGHKIDGAVTADSAAGLGSPLLPLGSPLLPLGSPLLA